MPTSGSCADGVPITAHEEKREAVSVFVLSEVRLYCEGLAQLLSTEPALRVLGAASPDAASLARIAAARPRVVLVDSLAVRRTEVVRQVVSATPATRVIAFALGDDHTEVLACAEAGVEGYVAREASIDELVHIVLNLDCAELPCSPRIATLMFRHATAAARRGGTSPVSSLTPREREIAGLIGRGLANKEIAAALSIELTTVKNHVHHILEKFRVRRRGAAAAKLRSTDLVPGI